MPKIRQNADGQSEATYDPNGPFTGNPHDDRPEVVTPRAAAERDREKTGREGSEITPDSDPANVPGRADEIEPWCREVEDDRIAYARRIGTALDVERNRPTPRSTVISKLEGLQAELSRSRTDGSTHDN